MLRSQHVVDSGEDERELTGLPSPRHSGCRSLFRDAGAIRAAAPVVALSLVLLVCLVVRPARPASGASVAKLALKSELLPCPVFDSWYCGNMANSEQFHTPTVQVCNEKCFQDIQCTGGYFFDTEKTCYLFGTAAAEDQFCDPPIQSNPDVHRFDCMQAAVSNNELVDALPVRGASVAKLALKSELLPCPVFDSWYCGNMANSEQFHTPTVQVCNEKCFQDIQCTGGYFFDTEETCFLFGTAAAEDQFCDPPIQSNPDVHRFDCMQAAVSNNELVDALPVRGASVAKLALKSELLPCPVFDSWYCGNMANSEQFHTPSVQVCNEKCFQDKQCTGGYFFDTEKTCFLFGTAAAEDQFCDPPIQSNSDVHRFDCMQATTSVSEAPLLEWYTYRAVSDDAFKGYGFGNINTGNAEGVMWYLTNEVVTQYGQGAQCPRKFNISKIMRFKITSKTTSELFEEGMNFGARFAFNRGTCAGRCFDGNLCTSEADCEDQYSKYGYILGCNNFWDLSAFPDYETSATNGIWYTFPSQGRCAATTQGRPTPTGAHDCTWTYEMAGELSLAEFEDAAPAPPGEGNCCDGRCSWVYDGDWMDTEAMAQRSQRLEDMFAKKYHSDPELSIPTCDFNPGKVYAEDNWERTKGSL